MNYSIDSEILQHVGPVPAVVHAIIEAHDTGDGTQLTYKQMAKLAGIPHISARRAVNKLRQEGLLKSEEVIQHGWQMANRYQIPTFVRPDPIEQTHAHSEQAPMYIDVRDREEVDTEENYQVEEVFLKENHQDTNLWGAASPALPQVGPDCDEVLLGTLGQVGHQGDHLAEPGQQVGARFARNRQQSLGARSARNRDNIFSRAVKIDEIVVCFKLHIEGADKRVVRDQKRIKGWSTSAKVLIHNDRRDVDEVLSVIDFCAQAGLLGKKRITNLKQIRDDYDHLLKCAQAGRLVDIGPLPSPNKERGDTRSALRRRLEEHS
jgi:hypothetical protein